MVSASDRNGRIGNGLMEAPGDCRHSVGQQSGNGERKGHPFDQVMTYTTFGPTILSAWTSFKPDDAQKPLKTAKMDALAFVGSDGQIRGAQFEQASRYYRTNYSSPLMSDMQLAQAIVTAF